MTHIDTAEMYGDAEVVVGRGHRGAAREGVPGVQGSAPERLTQGRGRRLRALAGAAQAPTGSTATSCTGAARIRSPTPSRPSRASVRDGKIRAWGVSNFDVDDLEEAHAIAGDGAIACNQVLYHVSERAIEHAVVPWCERHGIAVVAYSPFGSGSFPSDRSAGGRALAEIATARGATARQVALAFLLAIVRFSPFRRRHALRTWRTMQPPAISRSRQTRSRRIERAFPLGRKPSSLPMI